MRGVSGLLRCGLWGRIAARSAALGLRAVAGALVATLLGAGIAALALIALALLLGVGTLAEELHVVGLDFGGEALVAGLVRPLAGAKLPFDEELAAFMDEFLYVIG